VWNLRGERDGRALEDKRWRLEKTELQSHLAEKRARDHATMLVHSTAADELTDSDAARARKKSRRNRECRSHSR
jgi:hypothetical protein